MGNEEEIKKGNIGSKNRSRQVSVMKLIYMAILVFLQAFVFVFVYTVLQSTDMWWSIASLTVSMCVVIYIVNKQENPAYKLIWVILVLSFPLIGGTLYIILAGNRTRKKFIKKCCENHMDIFQYLPDDGHVQKEINDSSKSASAQSRYISNTVGFPAYKNTAVKYFSVGEDNYDELKKRLESAEKFIFMEYFIIKQGEMWDSILDILARKASEGVDVRLIYDDMGCAMWMPKRFLAHMKSLNIKAVPFNPLVPLFNLRQNNRDHRKITVVDGWVGFTGGINLADEYINVNCKLGHWKDTGVMLIGEAVWNLTIMFLKTWNMLTDEVEDYDKFKPHANHPEPFDDNGYVQPYGDTPVDSEIVGENIYLNMINKAKHYVYITTPYLIIDNELNTALCLAAKSGIDVRIITPGIPDKKMVFMVTQSYYPALIEAGVKIYEYTPGFIHAKTVIMDDQIATVGTVNFDYRSMYLHFECGVWMYDVDTVREIKEDIDKTLEVCDEVTLEEIKKDSNVVKRVKQSLLRLVAPLL